MLYEQDFHLWLESTVNCLRDRKLSQIDYDHLIEELESMVRSEKNALKSNLRILLMHILKYQYQPEKRSNSWRYTITEHRERIRDSLEDSPSFKPFLREIFAKCYQSSRKLAADETGLSINQFPQQCPFELDDILNLDYLPK